MQNYILTAPVWGWTARNLPCLCPNLPVNGLFEGFDSLPRICGSPTAWLLWAGWGDSQVWGLPLLLCRPPKEHVQAELRTLWPHGTRAEMGLCASTKNLLGSTRPGLNGTCAAGLTFLTGRLSAFHVCCSCSEVSQMHQFPCVCIIWAEILDRNMGILPLIPAALGEEEMSMTLH